MPFSNNITLLTIEDEETIRRSIVAFFQDCDIHVLEADNGRTGIEIFRSQKPDIILCDLRMPEIGGHEVIEVVTKEAPTTPIIIVSGTGILEDAIHAVRLGAWDYVLKPIYDMAILEHSVKKALERATLVKENQRYQKHLEQMVETRTNELEKAFHGIINAIATILEYRDPYTAGHQQRVANIAQEIAIEMNLDKNIIEGIYISGLIHDIGKIAIPAEILSKPTNLLDIEYMLIKNHPQTGYEILQNIAFPWPVATIVHQHHERLNGSGYPLGISGNAMLMQSKILIVSDVVEAMASHRPYRAALGVEKAVHELKGNRGKLYDPDIVDVLITVLGKRKIDLGS